MINKHNLKHVTGEWYLWHNIKNENALIPVIIASFLTFFFYNGWLISLSIWVWYFIYCTQNNEKLNKDPEILIDRLWWIQHHREKGDLEEFKRIIGIK